MAVLSVGVSRYLSPSISELKYAAADAETVAARLRDLYGYETTTLIGPDATKEAIDGSLDRYRDQLSESDCLIVYFAGHGQILDLRSYGRAGYLIPYDAELDLQDRSDANRWASEAIDVQQLVERTREMKAQHVLLIADACFSGFMTSRGNLEWRADLQALLGKPSRASLAATTDRQTAGEDGARGHGYFTAALLDRLDGIHKDGDAASVTDLFVEVRKLVARETKKSMTPQMSSTGEGEFVFLPLSIPQEEVEALRDDGLQDGDFGVMKGVVNRSLDRSTRRSTLGDLVEAYQAQDYRFTLDPEKGEAVWKAKRERFEENASLGDPVAMAAMHYCEADGLGGDKDPARAYFWAVRAHQSGHPAGKHVLGRCYRNGIGCPANELAGERLIDAAAADGSPISLISSSLDLLAKVDQQHRGVAVEFQAGETERLRSNLKTAAEAGVVEAGRILAIYAMNGLAGTPKAPAEGIRLLEDLARQSPSMANVALADYLIAGVPGVLPPDPNRAIEELRKAASAGFAEAQYKLAAIVFDDGSGTNDREAFLWAKLAHAQGFLGAESLLAEMYLSGVGAPKDPARALDLLEKGKAAGSKKAFLNLGILYFFGDSIVMKDRDKAIECLLRAGQLGLAEGWYWAGICYAEAYEEALAKSRESILTGGGPPRDAKALGENFARIDKFIEVTQNIHRDPLARLAALNFLKAARMGNSKAALEISKHGRFGNSQLVSWAKAELGVGDPIPEDWNRIPDWIKKKAEANPARKPGNR